MTRLRLLSSRHRLLALWLGLTVLCMRMLVPAGFMPVVDARGMTLRICPGMTVQVSRPQTAHAAMPGMSGHEQTAEHPPEHQGQPDQPCGFAGLTMPSLGMADPVLPAPLFAAGRVDVPIAQVLQIETPRAHLRPPPIGPPATA